MVIVGSSILKLDIISIRSSNSLDVSSILFSSSLPSLDLLTLFISKANLLTFVSYGFNPSGATKNSTHFFENSSYFSLTFTSRELTILRSAYLKSLREEIPPLKFLISANALTYSLIESKEPYFRLFNSSSALVLTSSTCFLVEVFILVTFSNSPMAKVADSLIFISTSFKLNISSLSNQK